MGCARGVGHGAAELLAKAGAHRTAQWLHRIPRGMSTALHQELHWLLYTELLEPPMCRRAGHRTAMRCCWTSSRTADCRAVRRICDATAPRRGSADVRAALARHLEEYGKTRGAVSNWPAACYAGDRVCRAEQGHPGALSAGTAAATAIAQHLAITNCWLGATVGAWYYAVFPVAASAGLVAATTGAMLAAIGVVTALAWIVLDPLLATTGIHRRRLDRSSPPWARAAWRPPRRVSGP